VGLSTCWRAATCAMPFALVCPLIAMCIGLTVEHLGHFVVNEDSGANHADNRPVCLTHSWFATHSNMPLFSEQSLLLRRRLQYLSQYIPISALKRPPLPPFSALNASMRIYTHSYCVISTT
jgi:hypothetical protein